MSNIDHARLNGNSIPIGNVGGKKALDAKMKAVCEVFRRWYEWAQTSLEKAETKIVENFKVPPGGS